MDQENRGSRSKSGDAMDHETANIHGTREKRSSESSKKAKRPAIRKSSLRHSGEKCRRKRVSFTSNTVAPSARAHPKAILARSQMRLWISGPSWVLVPLRSGATTWPCSARLSQVPSESLHKPLPIQQAREVLEKALRETELSDDDVSGLSWVARTVVRRVRRLVLRRVESWLNALIGEQARDASAVELTLHRVNELAHERLDEWVMDSLDGLRNKQALLWSGLFVVTAVVPPLALHFLR